MRVHQSGPRDAESIVFLHGVASSAAMWEAHVRQLAHYQSLRPDFPGFGDSADEPWVSIDHAAAEVAELVRARAGGRAHIVGLSLGGIVAIKLLAEAPELIDHAIVDGAGVLPIRGLALAKLALRLSPPIIKTNLVIGTAARSIGVPEADMEAFRRDYRRMSTAAFIAAFTEALDFRQPPGLESVQCPTLFVAGAREPASTHASNRLLSRTMPHAAAAIVPGKPHGWIAGAPLLHCRTVEAWINDRPLPAELAVVDS